MVAGPESTGDKATPSEQPVRRPTSDAVMCFLIYNTLILPLIFIFVNHATNHNWIWAHLNFSLTLYVELSTYSELLIRRNIPFYFTHPSPLAGQCRTHRDEQHRVEGMQNWGLGAPGPLQACHEWARRLAKNCSASPWLCPLSVKWEKWTGCSQRLLQL